MKVLVKFFASLREDIGVDELPLDLPVASSKVELMNQIGIAIGSVNLQKLHQPKVGIAINQNLKKGDFRLQENDEVAFFPPITGG